MSSLRVREYRVYLKLSETPFLDKNEWKHRTCNGIWTIYKQLNYLYTLKDLRSSSSLNLFWTVKVQLIWDLGSGDWRKPYKTTSITVSPTIHYTISAEVPLQYLDTSYDGLLSGWKFIDYKEKILLIVLGKRRVFMR